MARDTRGMPPRASSTEFRTPQRELAAHPATLRRFTRGPRRAACSESRCAADAAVEAALNGNVGQPRGVSWYINAHVNG